MENNYDDIINLPHHVSKNRKHMSNYERAAQFSPFAALKGYDDEIEEAARLTDDKWDIDERANDINEKLLLVKQKLSERPLVRVVYFVQDDKKQGGAYLTTEARAKKLFEQEGRLVLDNNITISFDDLSSIELLS